MEDIHRDKYRFKYAIMSGILHNELQKLVGAKRAEKMMVEAMAKAIELIDKSKEED